MIVFFPSPLYMEPMPSKTKSDPRIQCQYGACMELPISPHTVSRRRVRMKSELPRQKVWLGQWGGLAKGRPCIRVIQTSEVLVMVERRQLRLPPYIRLLLLDLLPPLGFRLTFIVLQGGSPPSTRRLFLELLSPFLAGTFMIYDE